MRVTKTELRHQIELLAKITGKDFDLDIAYGAYKLVAVGGSRNISARMSARELYAGIRTALNVLDLLDEERECDDEQS